MKRAKVYLSVLLVFCMLSTCGISAFASEISQFFVVINEGYEEGVSGYVYNTVSEGFIIHEVVDGKLNAGLVDEKGIVIPKSEKLFDYIDEDGYIPYYIPDGEDASLYGYMNKQGEVIIEAGKYDSVRYEGNDLFVVSKAASGDDFSNLYAVVDVSGNEVIPFGVYGNIDYIKSADAFVCEKTVDGKTRAGVIDAEGEEIIPFGEYFSIEYSAGRNVFKCSRTSEDGRYEDAVVDAEGNMVIPFNNSYITKIDGLIMTRDHSYKTYIIDWEGNVVEEITSDESANVWDSESRYSVYNRNENKTYIRDVNGEAVGVIPGYATRRDDVGDFETSVSNVDGYHMKMTYYSEEGEAGETVAYKDYSDYWNKHVMNNNSGVSATINDDTLTAQNEAGKVVFTSSEMYDYTTFNNGTVLFKNRDKKLATVINNKGDVLVPAGRYDNIEYCAELDVYAFEKDNKVYVGKICPVGVTLDGEKIEFDQNPVIKKGRTLVPVRAIFEALGASVDWNQETQTVTSVLGDKTVKLTIDSNIMYVNDKEIKLDVAAEIINSRTLVPVRAVSEAFECKVNWEDSSKTVIIEK